MLFYLVNFALMLIDFDLKLGTCYKPGETVPALMEYLAEKEKNSKVKIPFRKENVFCVDNEAFRFLLMSQQGVIVDENERTKFSDSWTASSSSSLKIVDYILKLKAMKMSDTILLNDSKAINNQVSVELNQHLVKLVEKRNSLINANPNLKNSKKDQAIVREKTNKIDCIIGNLIEAYSSIAYFTSQNAVSLYNDDLEAYLDENVRNEYRKSCIIPEYKSNEQDFKKLMNKYKGFKAEASKKNLSKDSLNNLYDRLYDILESSKRIINMPQ